MQLYLGAVVCSSRLGPPVTSSFLLLPSPVFHRPATAPTLTSKPLVRPHQDCDVHLSPASFATLGVPADLTAVLAGLGITTPTPIQAATLADSLAGRDVLGRGRTGSGKTYAFLLPMVTRLTQSQTKRAPGRPRALILAPTRELVAQIQASLAPLAEATNLRSVVVFGGVGHQPQIDKLRAGVDIV